MVYAISPEGQVFKFSCAHWVKWGDDGALLYKSNGGDFVAQVPKTWTVCFQHPDGVDPSRENTDCLLNELHALPSHQIAKLKKELKKFSLQSYTWKEQNDG